MKHHQKAFLPFLYERKETEEGKHDLFMDVNEDIRFRVIDEEFVDLTPEGPTSSSTTGAATTNSADAIASTDTHPKRSPYTITASISESGLGLLSWWS